MNGPVLTMAPAVEAATNLPFPRSHSTPDLLHQHHNLDYPGSAALASSTPKLDQRTLSIKSLPSLPAFDVPSLDFEFDFGSDFTSLRFDSGADKVDKPRPKTAGTHDTGVVEATTTAATPAPAVPLKKEKTSRRKSMIDRHRSWLPISKSSPDVRTTVRAVEDDTGVKHPKITTGPKDNGAKTTVSEKKLEVPPVPPLPPTKPVERTSSLVGFAKRAWVSSSSRSPSPSPKKGPKIHVPNRQRTSSNASIGKKPRAKFETGPPTDAPAELGRGSNTAADHIDTGPGLHVVGGAPRSSEEPSGSTGRALSRASSYLNKLKRPQSVFSKSASSLSLSASASTPNLFSSSRALAEDPDDTTITSIAESPVISLSSPSSTTVTLVSNSSAIAETKGDSPELTDNINTVVSNHRNSTTTDSSEHSDSTGALSENAFSQASADTSITMPHPSISRDPLWSTFKNLDAEYTKFVNKATTSAKMGILRCVLVPFLQSTAGHPSNSNRLLLTPEDVDRRAVVLNKWWNGLLEMLDAGQSVLAQRVHSNLGFEARTHANIQPVAGVDRPTLLEATAMIMMRPEWRLSTSYFQPLAERSPAEKVRVRSGSQSSTATGDWGESGGIIVETAEHNIRTMFVTNLTTQMAVVVDKMSMRHAPTSLVNWAGKACAYAFFFCPGVADVLVRLWGLLPDVVRRVADEFGLPRRNRGESEDIVALFPPNLGGLGWTSVKSIADKLRVAAKLPLLQAKIPWHGPWISRWRGSDTDLFYIFTKYYHILSEEFMPHDLPLIEQARAPAFVLLHAQLLANLDSTIHKMEAVDNLFASDQTPSADATMAALSQPVNSNMFRGMADNRLVLLLKDMLSDNAVGVFPTVKLTYAESFMRVMKAATKATSRYEHTSIHMLCDFLEEALPEYHAFQNGLNTDQAASTEHSAFDFDFPAHIGQAKQIELIDWPFWFDVTQKILSSNNTMAEFRVLSFIFTTWDLIATDQARKRSLVVDWLLSPETFDYCFNNWCPMVRAYYMRLLCWRICRDCGSPSELDEEIYLLVAERLQTVWGHYLWLKREAEDHGRLPPSTAPCPPTPQKRFMIIRTEVQTPAPGLFVGFDQSQAFASTPNQNYNLSGSASETTTAAQPDIASSPSKKKSVLSKVLSWSSTAGVGVGGVPTPFRRNASENDLERLRAETAASRTSSHQQLPPKSSDSGDSSSSGDSGLYYDEVKYQFRFTLTWVSPNVLAQLGQHRILTRPRLPAPAQARVVARGGGMLPMGGRSESAESMNYNNTSSPEVGSSGGLIAGARNATPLGSTLSTTSASTIKLVSTEIAEKAQSIAPSPARVGPFQPVRPTGLYAKNKAYIGRALAEWGIVVNECNSFVDRRIDEGVFGLGDIEVPLLGVEGLGLNRKG